MDCMALMGRVLYIYYVNVVLLSTSKDRVEAIRAASKRKGFACTVVRDDEHASAVIDRSSNEGILVVDAEATRDMDRMLKARRPNWPILVLSAHFDSTAWVELFKAGASEIVGDPLNPMKLDAAFDGFASATPAQSNRWWETIARRLGVR